MEATVKTEAIHNALSLSIQRVLTTADRAEADRLVELIQAQSYRNPTLLEGDSGCMLALLHMYEKTGDIRYLSCSREVLDTLYINYQQVSLGYGVAGILLAHLYFYFLTRDKQVLGQAHVLLEKLFVLLKIYPGRNYLPAGLAYGTTGIWLVLAACRPLWKEPVHADRLIERLLAYENDYLERNRTAGEATGAETVVEIDRLRKWAASHWGSGLSSVFSKYGSVPSHMLPVRPAVTFPNEPDGRTACESAAPFSPFLTSLLAIAGKIATLPPSLSLDIRQLAYQQVYTCFPRVVDHWPQPFDFTEVWDTDVIHTCLKFRQKIAASPRLAAVNPNLFQLESYKWDIELEIRKQSRRAFREAETKENEAIFQATMQEDSLFENIPLQIADHVFMLTLPQYVTKEPEIEIHPSKNYLVVWKPTLLADSDYTIVEDCLQGLGGLIKSISNYGKPITPAALARLVVSNQTADKEETYHRIIQSLRKFTFRRFLKPVNA